MEQTGATDKLPFKTVYALLQRGGHLFKASPMLQRMTVPWESAEQWWQQFASQSASPAPTQCPVCLLGQRLGVVKTSLIEPATHDLSNNLDDTSDDTSGTKEKTEVQRNLRTFEVTYSGHPHILDDDNTTDMLLIRDVTQQQKQSESVRHKISQYESICNFIQDVYYRIDMEGKILFISPSCHKLLYYHPSELLGTPFAHLTATPDDLQELLDILKTTYVVHDFYFLLHCKKGCQIPVSLTAKLVFGADGQRLAIEGIFRDVSERERLDTLLEERALTYRETLSHLEHLKHAVDQHAMLSITNPDGHILSVNEKFLEISRYSTEEVLGKTHTILNSGYHPKSFFKEMWRTLLRGAVWRGEMRNRKKNGDLFWVDGTIVPFLTPLGQPFQYVFIATDISSQVRTRTRLKRNRDFLHRAINAMGEGVIIMDLQGRLLALNKEGERLIGWQETELIHKNVHKAIHTEQPDGGLISVEECKVHQSMIGRAFRVEDDHYQRKDGTFLSVSHVISPLRDGKTIIGAIDIFRDNTRSRKRQLELEHARDAALKSAQMKSEFLANMSHEIRTPMNAIIGMNALLIETELDEEPLEFAEIIRDSAKSLLSLINDILDFSKIEAGKIDLDVLPFSPVTVVEGCAELLASQAQEKGLSLRIFISPKLPKILKGDPGRLRQMLLNLIGNAIKFTEEGKVVVQVQHDLDEQAKPNTSKRVMVRFSVTDTGIGLSEQIKEHLFEPFTQADRATNRKYGGTGLGLPITKRLAELMGGTIGMEPARNQPFGVGTTFWFCIPFQQTSSAETQISQEKIRAKITRVKPEATPDSKPKTALSAKEPQIADLNTDNARASGKQLLLVEDNPVNQKVTLLQLKKLGYAADAVGNGREALEAVSSHSYALILMDCQMPVMDGFEATHAIRKMHETGASRTAWHHIPIVAMTANAMKGDRERCLQAGMDDYLSKPVAPQTLLEKLQYWIPQSSAEPPPIEIRQLRQLFGNDDSMIRELLHHFPSSARELLDRLWQSVKETDKTLLNDTAFELQEACANMGAEGMATVARTLEQAAVEDDWTKAKAAMEHLERVFREIECYVQDY